MSVLPISRKRPPRGRRSSEASTNSPARALRTTSTPSPPVTSRNFSLNSRSREEAMWSSSRPASRSTSHLAGLAVAKTSAPRWRASWIAAIADAAGAGVDQHLLARLQPGEVEQAVVGGGEDDRHRRRLLEGPARRGSGRAGRARSSASGPKASAIIPITRSPGARSSTSEPTSSTTPAPSPPIAAVARVEAEGDQHVAEVEPRGVHLDPHLGRAQRLLRRWAAARGSPGCRACSASRRQGPAGGISESSLSSAGIARGTSALPRAGRAGAPRPRWPSAAGSRLLRGLAAVAVDQGEAAGVLGLGRADQAPDRGGGGVGGLVCRGGHRALGDQRQARLGLGLVGEPFLDRLQSVCGSRAGAPSQLPASPSASQCRTSTLGAARPRPLAAAGRPAPLEPQQPSHASALGAASCAGIEPGG